MPSKSSFPQRETSIPSVRLPIAQKTGLSWNLFTQGGMVDSYIQIQNKRILYGFDRVPAPYLRALSRTIPAQKAIRRIANGVMGMPWTIHPPKDKKDDKEALNLAEKIQKSLLKPNRDNHNTYNKLIQAIVADIFTIGYAAIERQEGKSEDNPDQLFWLWDADALKIISNPYEEWHASKEGVIPRYFDTGAKGSWKPIFNENLFLIQKEVNSHEEQPPSVLETAFYFIQAWLSISQFQERTSSQAIRDTMLSLPEIDAIELKAFREYWETEVVGQGRIPIIGGKAEVVKIGARTDDELYLKYTEYLLKIIALAMDLTPRDFNITEHDNRATAGAAADTAFADAILPMANVIAEHINIEIIDYYCPDFSFSYNDTEPRNEGSEATVAKTLFTDGKIITRNEARLRIGEQPLPPEKGDVFSDGSSLHGPPPGQPGALPAQPGALPAQPGVLPQDNGMTALPPSGNTTQQAAPTPEPEEDFLSLFDIDPDLMKSESIMASKKSKKRKTPDYIQMRLFKDE